MLNTSTIFDSYSKLKNLFILKPVWISLKNYMKHTTGILKEHIQILWNPRKIEYYDSLQKITPEISSTLNFLNEKQYILLWLYCCFIPNLFHNCKPLYNNIFHLILFAKKWRYRAPCTITCFSLILWHSVCSYPFHVGLQEVESIKSTCPWQWSISWFQRIRYYRIFNTTSRCAYILSYIFKISNHKHSSLIIIEPKYSA